MKALFINVKDLKRKSIISGNIDGDKIIQFIEVAQDTAIQNYLGGKLYKKMQSLIVNDTLTDAENANYKLLLTDYIKPMLIWYTQANYIPFAAYTVSNGGIFKRSPENTNEASQEEISLLTAKVTDTADFYTRRFIDFMNYNSTLYPEYTSNQDNDMYPDRDVQYTGFVL
jgi:hypothetical protein